MAVECVGELVENSMTRDQFIYSSCPWTDCSGNVGEKGRSKLN